MADLTNAKIANTYKDLLQVNAETSNAGLDGTVRTIQDGGGTASPIAMSTAQLNVTGQFALGGTVLTATADQLNDLAVGKLDTLTAGDDTVKLTIAGVSVSTATVSATVVVNPVLSLTEVDAATGSFNTKVSATNFVAGTGSFTTKVSGVAAEFSGNVSAANVYASTNIFVAGESIPSAITSVNAVIAAVSALTSVNKAAITSINAGPASTFDALTVKTTITVGPDTGGNKGINILSSDGLAVLEMGGATGAFIDLKVPSSDDFDLRLGSSGTGGYIRPSEGASLSILGSSETLATFTDDGSVALYHNNVKKLETAADGVDIDDINLGGKVLTITGDTGDTFTITAGAAGETTLATTDAAGTDGKMILDADGIIVIDSGSGTGGGDVHFKAGGTHYATINKSGNNAYFVNQISDGNINLRGNDGGSFINALTLDMSEAGLATFNDGATFNGDVTLTGAANNVVWDKSDNALEFADNAKAIFGTGGDLEIWHDGSNSNIKSGGAGSLIISSNFSETGIVVVPNGKVSLYYDNAEKLQTTATGATVTGAIVADSATVDDISLDGKVLTITGDTGDTFSITTGAAGFTTIATTDAAGADGHLLLDIDGAIILDAGDSLGQTQFKKAGTEYLRIFNSGSPATIHSIVSDADLVLSGNDGGSTVTALTLDMSEAGTATFNNDVIVNNTIKLPATTGPLIMTTGDLSTTDITLLRTGFNTDSAEFGFDIKYMGSRAGNANSYSLFMHNQNGTHVEAMTVLQDGKVGIGNTSPTSTLHVTGDATVDDINLNGKVLTITGDTDDTFKITTGGSGATTLSTIDTASNNGRMTLDADGYIELDSGGDYGEIYFDKQGTNYGQVFTGDGSDFRIRSNVDNGDMKFAGKDGGTFITALTLDMSEAGKAIFNKGATFADDVTVEDINLSGKVLTITGDTGDTFTITTGAAGATTLATTDAAGQAGNLTLDPDGQLFLDVGYGYGTIDIKRQGTSYLRINTQDDTTGHVYIASQAQDADIKIIGNDGGSNVTAVHFDMSEAGKANFSAGANFNNDVTLTTGKVGIELTNSAAPIASLNIANDSADGTVDYTQGIVFSDSTTGGTPWTHAGIVATGSTGYNGNLIFATDGNDAQNSDTSGLSERMRIAADGKVGIGTTAPLKKLHVDGPALSTVKTLTDASTVASDFDVGQNFTLTLAGNRTLGAPSNVDAGQVGSIFIIQDGTGSRTLAYNSIWKFAGGTAPTLSTAAGAIDRLDYIVQSGTAIQALLTKAYA